MEDRSFSRLIKDEVCSLGKNGMIIFSSCCLVILVFLIGFVYQKGVLDQMPLVIVDQDGTSLSRTVARQFLESEKFSVTFALDYPTLLEEIREGRAEASLLLPKGLSQDVKGLRGGEVLFLVDGTNYIIANSAYAKANEILQTINGGLALKILEGKGLLTGEGEKLVQSVKLEQKILYNPSYNYAYYLSYGVFSAGIFSLLMSSLAITFSRQLAKKRLTKRDWMAKYLVYGGYACLLTNIIFKLAQWAFYLPALGSWGKFFALTFFYGYLVVIFALILLSIAGEELKILQAGVFVATPLFFLTGYTWPLQSIPNILRPLYYICPMTPFFNGMRAALVTGADWSVILKYCLWQFALIMIYLPIALILFKWRVSRGRGC